MASKPNLIFLMPDQLRADFLSCYGANFIHTPHIDSLADQGVLYQNAYTPSPLCVPARCVLLTGCNAIKTGVLTNERSLERGGLQRIYRSPEKKGARPLRRPRQTDRPRGRRHPGCLKRNGTTGKHRHHFCQRPRRPPGRPQPHWQGRLLPIQHQGPPAGALARGDRRRGLRRPGQHRGHHRHPTPTGWLPAPGLPGFHSTSPLPSSPLQSPRQSIFGFLANGCMHFDGEWKLVKYTSGATLLFNLLEDPKEQHNRIDDPACLPVYRRLDAELTGQILNSIHAGHAEKKVAHNLLFNDEEFGQKGWHRSYPQAVGPS